MYPNTMDFSTNAVIYSDSAVHQGIYSDGRETLLRLFMEEIDNISQWIETESR